MELKFDLEYLRNLSFPAYFNGKIVDFSFSSVETKYVVLLFYPLDFTIVCPTELSKFSDIAEEFRKIDTSVVFISSDSEFSHKTWSSMPINDGGIGEMNWPMLSDRKLIFADLFDVYDYEMAAFNRVSLILSFKDSLIKHFSLNNKKIGRSTKEVIRIIKALEHSEKNDTMCPVDLFAE